MTDGTSTTSATTVPAELPTIDLAASAIGGYTLGSPADDVVDAFSAALGSPSTDSEWGPVSPLSACLGASEIRNVTWGDTRLQIERTADDDVVLGGWVVGEGFILGSTAPEPADGATTEATDITTTGGAGVGSPASAITDSIDVFDNDDSLLVANAAAVVIRLDDQRTITGFASGRNDCLEPSITSLSCDTPVPIRTLPDGTATSDDSYTYLADGAVWSDDPNISDDSADVGDDNTVIQTFDVDTAAAEAARTAPIGVQRGDLDLRAIPTGDLPTSGSVVFVYDDRSDCVRQLAVGPGLDESGLQSYLGVLAEGFEPLR